MERTRYYLLLTALARRYLRKKKSDKLGSASFLRELTLRKKGLHNVMRAVDHDERYVTLGRLYGSQSYP